MTGTDKKVEDIQVRAICDSHQNEPSALIEILHDCQKAQGQVTDLAMRTIAHALNISRAEVYGVTTFYHDFRRTEPAQHSMKICRAEACQAVGCEELAAHAEAKLRTKFGAKSPDGQFELSAVYCLGNCALGPAVMIDEELYGRVTAERLDQLIGQRR